MAKKNRLHGRNRNKGATAAHALRFVLNEAWRSLLLLIPILLFCLLTNASLTETGLRRAPANAEPTAPARVRPTAQPSAPIISAVMEVLPFADHSTTDTPKTAKGKHEFPKSSYQYAPAGAFGNITAQERANTGKGQGLSRSDGMIGKSAPLAVGTPPSSALNRSTSPARTPFRGMNDNSGNPNRMLQPPGNPGIPDAMINVQPIQNMPPTITPIIRLPIETNVR
ncbi:MAG: hypothetical protein NTX50_12265 [Candidatus Sumerlaeota bacterium]|nr:hypothetical protein [Candidatus Sumerlaeota bacterium]